MRPSAKSLLTARGHLTSLLRNHLFRYYRRTDSPVDAKETADSTLRWMRESVVQRGVRSPDRALLNMVRRHVEKDEPLAYILGMRVPLRTHCPCSSLHVGTQPFGPLDLDIEAPILIPRPETEEWSTKLADILHTQLSSITKKSPAITILDICCGSGCIGLLLAERLRNTSADIQILGIDISSQAISLSQRNAKKHVIENASFLQIDLFDRNFTANLALHLPHGADLIVSNPPYIPLAEYDQLAASVRDHEDKRALLGRHGLGSDPTFDDGAAFYRRLAELAPQLLSKSTRRSETLPTMVVEVGAGQADLVSRILARNAGSLRIEKDFAGIQRTVWQYRE